MNNIERLAIFGLAYVIVLFLASLMIERSIRLALNSLKLAIKSEFTTSVGRLNLVAMILFAVIMIVFNLHQMVSDALTAEGSGPIENHVLVPTVVVALFFLGSLILVMLFEKQNTR